jgi:hypothetical protein
MGGEYTGARAGAREKATEAPFSSMFSNLLGFSAIAGTCERAGGASGQRAETYY